jgi:hypothetical protein|tara:strand:+ start:5088 stop:5471 length:384 start_codon:yes stop_codon:yes gene_type:complete
MATTVKITISSPNLTSDTLNINKTMTLKSAAGADITQTSGLNRVNGLNSITTVFAAADFSNDEAYLFLHNTDSTRGNQVTLTLGSQKTAVIQGGDSVFMAIDPSALDIKLTADSASTTVEYQLFHNG